MSISEILGATVALASVLGLGVQLLVLRRDRAHAIPVPVGADDSESVSRRPSPGRPQFSESDSGFGSFFFGVWQLLLLANAYGWMTYPEQMQQYLSIAAEGLQTRLWFVAGGLVANAIWAALLAYRHWPDRDHGFRRANDRLWFYLVYVPLSLAGATVVTVRSADVMF